MKSIFEKVIFMIIGAIIALSRGLCRTFYLGNNGLGGNKVSDHMSKYSEEEKFVINELRESMHDPSSLQVISIDSERMLSYDGFDDWSLQTRIYLLEKEDVKVYKIKYRGANAYGALRIGEATGVYWKDSILGETCLFIDEEDKSRLKPIKYTIPVRVQNY